MKKTVFFATTDEMVENEDLNSEMEKYFELFYKKLKENKNKVLKTIFQIFWWQILQFVLQRLIGALLQNIQPLVWYKVMKGFQNQDTRSLYFWCLTSFILKLILLIYNSFPVKLNARFRVVSSLQYAVFRKSLKIYDLKKNMTDAISVFQIETSRIFFPISNIVNAVVYVLELVIIVMYLYYFLGWVAFFVFMSLCAVIVPINKFGLNKTRSLNEEKSLIFRRRLKLMNSSIKNMRLIKSYNIEQVKLEKLKSIKNDEIQAKRKSRLFLFARWGVSDLVVFFMQALIILFYSYHHPLTAPECFTIQGAIDQIVKPFTSLARCLDDYYMSKRWIKSITDFLNLEEVESSEEINEKSKIEKKNEEEEEEIIIDYENCGFSWNPQKNICDTENDDLVLKNMNVRIKKGEHIGVFGPVGSGKTSFLLSIVGEMVCVLGKRKVSLNNSSNEKNGKKCVCFCPQENWILKKTVQDNIILGSPYDEKRYNECLKCCALEQDLSEFPNFDLTRVDQNCLSGGQKLRISLARLLYHKDEADLFIFDDPFQQLDSSVANFVFNSIFKKILKNKTVILVTHHIQFTKDMDRIIMMKDGTIEKIGLFSEFHNGNWMISKTQDDGEEEEHKNKKNGKLKILSEEEYKENQKKYNEYIDFKLIWKFISNSKIIIFHISLALVFIFLRKYRRVFLSNWMKNDPEHKINSLQYYISWYIIIGVAKTFLYYITRGVYEHYFLDISENVHSKLLEKVFSAKIRFFDTRSIGSIVSRFTQDLSVLEESLMHRYRVTVEIIILHSYTYILIFYETPWYFFLFIPLCLIILRIGKQYVRGYMEYCRITEEHPARVYDFISESLSGINTIRSMKKQQIFIGKFKEEVKLQNQYLVKRIYLNQWMRRWISLFRFLCNHIFMLFAIYLNIPASSFILTYSNITSINHHFTYLIRLIPDLRRDVLTLERLEEFESIESESYEGINPMVSKKPFPRGKIEFDNVSFRYGEKGKEINQEQDSLVLKNISFQLDVGERLGICGRTGDGKSTLVKLLFRFYELDETNGGTILVDDIPISKLTLESIRSNIAYIPQNPILLGETLKECIDHRNEFSEEMLNKILERVHINMDQIRKFGGVGNILMDKIKFSEGEKQLLCFARAVLNKKRVLILDEHSNSTDFETDRKIQKLMDEEFGEKCFVICIAHRLETIMEFDKILVLRKGKIKQFGKPSILLEEENSLLKKMVENLGGERSKILKNIGMK